MNTILDCLRTSGYEDALRAIQTFRPFIQKWGCMSKDYDTICQQALQQIQQPDFHITYKLLTVWGVVPA
jgi:hypothetical protein